jgi:hypothetical protein
MGCADVGAAGTGACCACACACAIDAQDAAANTAAINFFIIW